jgi:hypothetical protein
VHRGDFTPGHQRSKVLSNTAVLMADGPNTMRVVGVFRHQSDLFDGVSFPAVLMSTRPGDGGGHMTAFADASR